MSSDDLSTIGLSELLGITDNNDKDADLLSSSEVTVSPLSRTGRIDESTEDGGAGDVAAATATLAPDDWTNDGEYHHRGNKQICPCREKVPHSPSRG